MNDSPPVSPGTSRGLLRRLVAEFVGTGLLLTTVVGSGIAAQRLSPADTGLQLLENSLATALGLGVFILMLGPVSGAHFNPAVTLASWFLGRRTRTGLPLRDVTPYVIAQVLGGVGGTLLAGAMFDVTPAYSTNDRLSTGDLLGEVVATAGLVMVVFALARTSTPAVTAAAVGSYIGAAYWFTSSTSFANPAVAVARMFTDTFTGIAPTAVLPFVGAQLAGAAVGLAIVLYLFPRVDRSAGDVVIPSQP